MAVKHIDSLPSKKELDQWLEEHGYAFDDTARLQDVSVEDVVDLLSFLGVETVGDLVAFVSVDRGWL
ncbi:hypothetical protein ABC389_10645 [Limosilactobacillus sp. WILCCON 0053]|uniref:hypothetical protein n=1 Tax=Limosilactobacillus allomucosae TaxID=3142938 RepID=UPI0032631AB7